MVEQALANAQARLEVIPLRAAKAINSVLEVDIERAKEIEKTTQHDFNSFIESIAEHMHNNNSSYFHFGATSSDIVDTALSLKMKAVTRHWIDLVKPKASFPWMTAFDLLRKAEYEIGVGKMSGPVGTHASLAPDIEKEALRQLGLRPIHSTQVIPRDVHATWAALLTAVGLLFNGPATMGNGALQVALQNVALWHERDISHSSNERIWIPAISAELDVLIHRRLLDNSN